MDNIAEMQRTLNRLVNLAKRVSEYRSSWRCIVGLTDTRFSPKDIERMLCNLERYRMDMWRALGRLEDEHDPQS